MAEANPASSSSPLTLKRSTPPAARPGHGVKFAGNMVPLPQVRKRGDLPTFTLEYFRKGSDDRVWVALDGGVYDMTPFLDAHPGGAHRIMMVNGSDLGKFLKVYALHNRPHIRELIEQYRIGNLSDSDMAIVTASTEFADYYGNDPARPQFDKGNLRVTSRAPWNHEPGHLKDLVETFYTPNDLFFVRNHNQVPEIDVADYTLEVEGNDAIGITADRAFTLDQLMNDFPKHEVVSALQCAGNRQEDYVTLDRPLYVAPHWRNGAIGCAKWGGVRVRDVLGACGVDVDAISLRTRGTNGVKIVNFIAADTDETGVPYAGVIPIEKALDPFGDAILAYEMNGEPLPRDHGAPVRLIAPGHAGCRNVKWVQQIILSAAASELDSGSRLDRHYSPDVSWDSHRDHTADERCPGEADCHAHGEVRMDTGPVIQTGPVTSIICVPGANQKLGMENGKREFVEVKGVAWSGGGRGICRVEVSLDGGKTFEPADLKNKENPDRSPCPHTGHEKPTPEMGMGRNYAWTQFHRNVRIPEDLRRRAANGEAVTLEVVCKAVDGDMNQQPDKMMDNWNVLGIAVNHWHRIPVVLDPTQHCEHCSTMPEPPGPGQYVDSEGNSWERNEGRTKEGHGLIN